MQSTRRMPGFSSEHRWELLALPAAVLIGASAVIAPAYLFAGIGTALMLFLLSRGPLMRATIVIVGGLTVFQISAGLTIEKVAYLGVVLVATLFALQHIVSRWSCARALGAPSILFATGLVGLVVAVSPIAALQTGFTIEAWALDVPAYGMLVTAVILGLDLALSDHSPKHIATVVLLSGLVGAVGYASYFIGLRGIAEFGASRFVAVSTFLPAAAFCLGLAYVFDGTRPYFMALLATLVSVTTLFSGSRIVILFIVPIIVTVGVARRRRFRVVALIVGAVFALALVGGLLTLTGATQYLNLDLLQSRLAGIIPLLTSQDLTVDQSLYLRAIQTQVLEAAWLQSPLFGAGPGGLYSYGNLVNHQPVDSPIAILARFGVVGATAFFILFWILLTSKLRRGAYWVPATALLSFISLVLAWSLVSSPLDDKGVSLGLIPLIALCGVWRKGVSNQPSMAGRTATQPARMNSCSVVWLTTAVPGIVACPAWAPKGRRPPLMASVVVPVVLFERPTVGCVPPTPSRAM